MQKSSSSCASSEATKPAKPYEGFPLFAHASGRWAKKIRQQIHFFGRWGTTVKGKIVPAEDVDSTASKALEEFNRQWPYLSEGRTAPPVGSKGGCTIRDLCNAFLTHKKGRVETKELSGYSFAEYNRMTDAIMAHFGRDRCVDDLRPDDFEAFRLFLAKGCNVVTLKSKVNRARVVFKFASDRRLIDRPVGYGGAFDRPSSKVLRAARNDAGERLISRNDLLKILDVLDGKPVAVGDKVIKLEKSASMKAMVLLGLNAGFGNTDVSSLPRKAVNLETGWVVFPRPKTAVKRRVPLWPETVEAVRAAIAERPEPIDPADSDCCFLTERGTRFVRLQPSGTEGKVVNINALSRRFESILTKLGIGERKGVNFYTLRHVFETHSGDAIDQVATDAIMGHVDPSMGANYRQSIFDERLKTVVNTVRGWLFGEGGAK